MKLNLILSFLLYSLFNITNQEEESLLKGTMISSDENSNLIKFAFDSRFNTQFRSKNESNGWVGIYLRNSYIITRIEWGTNETDNSTYLLGIFEGANNKNFEDGRTLYMITKTAKINANNNIEVEVKMPFQYIRYIGPSGQYCKINNFKIYGYSSDEGSMAYYYKPSNLPLLTIHSSFGNEPNKITDIINCIFFLFNEIVEINDAHGIFRLRGIEALNLYKKSYYIEFDDAQNILNFNSFSKKYVLIASFGDKTLIRNLLSFEISKIFEMEYTIKCSPIDLIINGEYKGTYNLCEQIEFSEQKINIPLTKNTDNSEPEISGGYLLDIDGFAYLKSLYFNSKKGIPISIIYPNEEDNENKISLQQKNYIEEKFDQFEIDIYNNNITNIDITSFVKYFLIEELIGNAEAYWSTFIFKNRNDDKFYFGPITDNDMGYDNDIRAYPINCQSNYAFNYGLAAGTTNRLINKIIKNEEVSKKIKEKWSEIRNILNLDDLYNYINSITELISKSKDLNFIRWNILNKQVAYNPKIYGSYEEEIKILKKFIKNRINFLNNYILNITTENEFFCDILIPNDESKKELDYEFDEEEQNNELNEVSYQLLPNSYNYMKKEFFHIFILILLF